MSGRATGVALLGVPALFVLLAGCTNLRCKQDPRYSNECCDLGYDEACSSGTDTDTPTDTPTDTDTDCEALAGHAQTYLGDYCNSCHGAGGSVEGGFNYSLDVSRMKATGKITEGDSAASRIYVRAAADTMPPAGNEPRPTADETEDLRVWIDECDALDWSGGLTRSFIDPSDELDAMYDDMVANYDKDERIYIRYFTLVHLYNGGVGDDELTTYKFGLFKAVHSLSTAKSITSTNPVAVPIEGVTLSDGSTDPKAQEILFRIDLRHYGWDRTPVDAWEHLLKDLPHGISRGEASSLRSNTESRLPYLNADWFVKAALRPPLYGDVLDLPPTLDGNTGATAEFLEQWGIKRLREDGINKRQVARSGFQQSGVSVSNRMIERHETDHGSCWVSYDFADSSGAGRLTTHPIEGNEPEPDAVDMAGTSFEDFIFDEDGGEVICSLPNGLQVYYLAKADGEGIDEGPTNIVLHEENAEDGAKVINGISCFYCHYAGQIFKPDEIADHWADNEGQYGYPAGIAELVEETYVPAAEFEALQQEDQDRFLAAIEDMGASTSIDANGEPVWALGADFREDMDLARVLGEFGLDADEFDQHLDDATEPEVIRVFGGLTSAGAVIAREEFLENATLAACDFGLADSDQCNGVDPCGESGIACLDGQSCQTDGGRDDGACVAD